MIHQKTPMRRLNMMNAHGFVRTVGEAFEHSPWVAERAFHFHPFKSIDDLHQKMCQVVKDASEQDKIALIRAHPDLVGRLAQPGPQRSIVGAPLTPQSQAEQAAAGLDKLSEEERETFGAYNDVYREQFDFPFIICARESRKEAILAAFPRRLKHTRQREIDVNIEEICKIARLRLLDVLCEE